MGQNSSHASPFGPEHTKSIVLPSSVNDFAFRTLHLFTGEDKTNSCYSPYSAFVVFCLASQLFTERTREEMLRSLITKPTATIEEISQALQPFLTKNIDPSTLKICNSIWPNKAIEFPENFFKPLNDLNIETKLVSYPEEAKEQINQAVSDATGGKIQNLIGDREITAETALYLVNALYFNGKWKDKFKEDHNTKEMFHLLDEAKSEVETTFMHLDKVNLEYIEDSEIQSVSLFYEGRCPYAMTLMLPKKTGKEKLEQLIKNMSFERFTKLHNSMERKEIILSIPKFSVEGNLIDMIPAFKELGAQKVFSPTEAESQVRNFYVSAIIQKSSIIVNEEGTEAAAASACRGGKTCCGIEEEEQEPIVFKADHPFIYIIRHKYTGAIIFIGVIKNPAE